MKAHCYMNDAPSQMTKTRLQGFLMSELRVPSSLLLPSYNAKNIVAPVSFSGAIIDFILYIRASGYHF